MGASDDEESAPEPDHEFDSDDLTSDQKWLVACLLDSFVFHDMQHRWLVRAVSKMRRLVFPRGTQIVGQGDIVGPQDYMVVVQVTPEPSLLSHSLLPRPPSSSPTHLPPSPSHLRLPAFPRSPRPHSLLQEGEIDVVIYGSLEELERMSEGNPAAEVVQDPRDPTLHSLRFPQGPGKILGDLAMLFNSPRSATMLARTGERLRRRLAAWP